MFRSDEQLASYLAERDFPETIEGKHTAPTPTARIAGLYDGSVRWLDDQLEPLLDGLRAREDWERTLVVIVGDHGQGLGQHEYLAHGTVWQEQIHVPLLMRVPGEAPRRIAEPIAMVDVLSTVLGLAAGLGGRDFLSQSQGADVLAGRGEPQAIFAMSPPERGLEAITDGRWKYIHDREGEHGLYDLASDPHELVNLTREHPEQAARMAQELSSMVEAQRARGEVHRAARPADAGEPVDPELLRELEALGYGGGEE